MDKIIISCISGLPWFDSRRSSRSSSSTSLNNSFDDRLSLRPELDRCPSPLAFASGGSPRGSILRLAPRHEYERSSIPGRLKYLNSKQDSVSSSPSDVSEIKTKKRPFSLGVGELLPKPSFQLSPLGGAKSKVPIKKMPSAPSVVSKKSKSGKTRIDSLEMNTFKLRLGDGSEIGSSSTDDLDTSPLWEPKPSSMLPEKLRLYHGGYNRMEEEEVVSGSIHSLNSSGSSSAVFSLGSPDPGSIYDQESGHFIHSTPKEITSNEVLQRETKKGSDAFYQTFIEGDLDSSNKSSPTSIPSPVLNTIFKTSISRHTPNGVPQSLLNRDSGLSEISSPVSIDSEASHFSYSDLPAITISFVNETDEITQL